MSEEQDFIRLVILAAKLRGNPPVEREYIEEALRRITLRLSKVVRYPATDKLSFRGVYDLAAKRKKIHQKNVSAALS